MSSSNNNSSVDRIFEEAFNQGRMSVIDEVLTPEHCSHIAFGGLPNGPQGLKWLVAMFRTGFPNLHCIVEDEIRAGEKLAAHWTMHGTHMGLFMGTPPTGKLIQAQGIIFARLEHGMMVEYWMLIDQIGLLQQLGIIPH